MNKNVTYIPLTGGLGNQLFQLAFGLSVCGENQLMLEPVLAKPRKTEDGRPELSAFVLPSNVTFFQGKKKVWLASKSSGYLLRMGIAPRNFEKRKFASTVLRFLGTFVVSNYFRTLLGIYSANDVGFDSKAGLEKGKYIIGYHQTFRWASSKSNHFDMKTLKLVEPGQAVRNYKELSIIEKPLVVHVRLGDYKNEESFGIPSKEYYERAISQLWGSGLYKKIWLFSDEPELAIDYIPNQMFEHIRWIENIEGSSARTLEVMRFGHGYVIGNSTYSWWGAYLSYNSKPVVIAPSPWFQKIISPRDITPPEWQRMNAW
jgi:hypothetical protein